MPSIRHIDALLGTSWTWDDDDDDDLEPLMADREPESGLDDRSRAQAH